MHLVEKVPETQESKKKRKKKNSLNVPVFIQKQPNEYRATQFQNVLQITDVCQFFFFGQLLWPTTPKQSQSPPQKSSILIAETQKKICVIFEQLIVFDW